MQINNLKITNFRTIESLSFNPGKVNVIIGHNGAGKSSTLEAISYLLTNKVGNNPIREGAALTTVEAEVMGTPFLRRYKTTGSTVKMNGKMTTQKSVQEWIESETGITADTIRVATSSGMLASMNSRELSAYLINNNLIPAEIDMDVLKMLCTISPEVEAILTGYLPEAPIKFNMDDIQEAYSNVYAIRPLLKKQLAELKAQANYTGVKSTMTLDQIDAELGKLAAYSAAWASYEKLRTAYQAALNRRASVQAQISTLEEQIKKSTAAPVDPKEIEFLRNEEKRIRQKIFETTKEIQVIDANLKIFLTTLENLDRPVCPISNKLVCTTDKTAIKNELTELVVQNKELKESKASELEKLNERQQKFCQKIADFEKRRDAYREFEALCAKRSSLKSTLPEIPEKPEEPAKVENAEARIAELKAHREFIYKEEAAKKAEKEIPSVEAEIALYDEVIELLCPRGGIREKIIEAAFEPLIEHCNERAKELRSDFRISLVSDDGVHIMCKPTGLTDMLPLNAVSSGEQLLAMFLILDAINALSNLGILLLDDLDKLDGNALDALFDLLRNPDVAKSYDHIFIAMVNHEDSLKVLSKYSANIDNLIAL